MIEKFNMDSKAECDQLNLAHKTSNRTHLAINEDMVLAISMFTRLTRVLMTSSTLQSYLIPFAWFTLDVTSERAVFYVRANTV